jgi:hypothetical protein
MALGRRRVRVSQADTVTVTVTPQSYPAATEGQTRSRWRRHYGPRIQVRNFTAGQLEFHESPSRCPGQAGLIQIRRLRSNFIHITDSDLGPAPGPALRLRTVTNPQHLIRICFRRCPTSCPGGRRLSASPGPGIR